MKEIIEAILSSKSIEIHFQPIMSARNNKVIGIEALARGIHPVSGEYIAPYPMFQSAARLGLNLELDRLCRENALKAYQKLRRSCKFEPLLFLNLDASIIDQGVVGSGHFIGVVEQLGLNPAQIIIEIVESEVQDTEALCRFIDVYRSYGFLIALDDIGFGFSNLDRVLHVKPDVFKIDKGLIRNIHADYYKQELFQAMANMAKKFGSLIVAEGVENKEEAIMSLMLGADMLQGFYFARPGRDVGQLIEAADTGMVDTAAQFKKFKIDTIISKRSCKKTQEHIVDKILGCLRLTTAPAFENTLREIIGTNSAIEYLYILDMTGRQITDSVQCAEANRDRRSWILQASEKYSDQSTRDYYIHIQSGKKRYTSEPYMSLATGSLCTTISAVFADVTGERYILCADFRPCLSQQA